MRTHPITETELAILQILWDRGETTSREIAEALYVEATDPKVSTVQKLIERLESKGFVERDRSERAHRFRALVSRDQFLQHRLQAMADRLCDGSWVPLLTALLHAKGVSKTDQEKLRALVEKLWPEGGSSTK